MEIKFKTELWEWQGPSAWCFVTVPEVYYDDIKQLSNTPARGFGMVKVEATIAQSTWHTSIFPDTKSKSYLLPVKKAVRKAENLNIEDKIAVKIKLMVNM